MVLCGAGELGDGLGVNALDEVSPRFVSCVVTLSGAVTSDFGVVGSGVFRARVSSVLIAWAICCSAVAQMSFR